MRARHADPSQRELDYLRTIMQSLETMKGLPIEVYIVENNGERRTLLNDISGVHLVYTDTNQIPYTGSNPDAQTGLKGMKEMLDIHRVCDLFNFDEEDIVIKMTGRYSLEAPQLYVRTVIEQEPNYDAFIKFLNICTMKYDPTDCVLGLFAIRYKYLQNFNPRFMLEQPSSEQIFAVYVRNTIPPERICEVTHLGLYLPREHDSLV
jgi:hypothetical protein